jgi:putative peptidoglycan lipid II flippase
MPDRSAPPGTPASGAAATNAGRGIAAAALLIAGGNIASRVLGLLRESAIANQFPLGAVTSAFAIASLVPTQLYDLLVGGLLSAALIPVFSELAERDERELGRVAGTIFTLATLALLAAAALVWLFTPQLGTLLTLGADATQPDFALLRRTTTDLIPWMLPATICMVLAGLMTGLLQAQRRFLLPAFSAATFNAGVIAGALLLSARLGVRSLAIGMLIGGVGQVLLQLPGLRGVPLRWELNVHQPHVRRIGVLYAPVLLGLGFGLVGSVVDRALAAGVNEGAAAQMRYATTLIQFALGVVATAVSLAALPTLSRQAVDDPRAFRATLALGIKALLFLLLPITALLGALAQPVCSLLFRGGATSAASTGAIAGAVVLYLPMLVAAGIDQPLIVAFYARRNTLLPNVVNGAAIAAYLVTAFLLVQPFGVRGLIVGNVVQWWTHAAIMAWFAQRRFGAFGGQRLGEALWKGIVASAGAGAACWTLQQVIGTPTTRSWLLGAQIMALGGVGLVIYLALAAVLRIEALAVFGAAVRRRTTNDERRTTNNQGKNS